jgi:hypothetical protein
MEVDIAEPIQFDSQNVWELEVSTNRVTDISIDSSPKNIHINLHVKSPARIECEGTLTRIFEEIALTCREDFSSTGASAPLSMQLFSLFSMTRLGNAKKVVLSRCRLLMNMTNGVKLSYYRGNTKTYAILALYIYNELKQY